MSRVVTHVFCQRTLNRALEGGGPLIINRYADLLGQDLGGLQAHDDARID